jgi:hypothetical protein
MIAVENKNSFFSLTLPISNNQNEIHIEKLKDKTDLVLNLMNVRNTFYQFEQKENNQLLFFFKTDSRKRKGQLTKYCEQVFPENQQFTVQGLTKFNFDSSIERMKKNNHFNLSKEPSTFDEYTGSDIKIFDNDKNWYPWQKELYQKLFNSDNSFRQPDGRKIISIIDKTGNNGKSSFYKFLFFHHAEFIGRIGYGSASQLRSSCVNIGKKNVYIIDLARSKSKNDKEEDLLSVLEDLKTGLITTSMYGSGGTLLMDPPNIVVSSNYALNYELLSADRWEVYEIRSHKLKKINTKNKTIVKKS